MPRRIFPDDRLVYAQNGAAGDILRGSAGSTATVFSNAAGTTLANILNEDGSANTTSKLTVDAYTRLPLFQGPNDDTDTLYVSVAGGPVVAIYARVDDRLDALQATKLPLSMRGAASGVATLDAASRLPVEQLPTGAALLTASQTFTGTQTLVPAAASANALVIRAVTSQTADLQRWENSTGTVLTSVTATGALGLGAAGFLYARADGRGIGADVSSTATVPRMTLDSTAGRLYLNPVQESAFDPASVDATLSVVARGSVSAGLFVGHASAASTQGAIVRVVSRLAADAPLSARGAAGQTADLQRWENSTGTVLAKVDALGAFTATLGGLLRTLDVGAVDSAGVGFRTVRVAN